MQFSRFWNLDQHGRWFDWQYETVTYKTLAISYHSFSQLKYSHRSLTHDITSAISSLANQTPAKSDQMDHEWGHHLETVDQAERETVLLSFYLSLLKTGEDRWKNVDEVAVSMSSQCLDFTLLSMNYLWSQRWQKRMRLIRRHLQLFWYLREEWRGNIHIQGVMCIRQAFVQLYTHLHTSMPLICGERHLIAHFWLRWESASQRCVSCLLTRAENRSHAWSVELVSCLVL